MSCTEAALVPAESHHIPGSGVSDHSPSRPSACEGGGRESAPDASNAAHPPKVKFPRPSAHSFVQQAAPPVGGCPAFSFRLSESSRLGGEATL